jgi:hypothetical protein
MVLGVRLFALWSRWGLEANVSLFYEQAASETDRIDLRIFNCICSVHTLTRLILGKEGRLWSFGDIKIRDDLKYIQDNRS